MDERSTPALATPPNRIIREVLAVYLGTLLAIKGVVVGQRMLGLPADLLIAVPLLFIYVPLLVLRWRGKDPADLGMVIDRIGPALRLNLGLWLAVLLPFIAVNHIYQAAIFHRSPALIFPDQFLVDVLLYHLLYVALAEEFFYRGYMQSRLGQVFRPRWRVLGVSFGWELPLTALLFTVGHSIVEFRWWHFSILAPALVFGWIRARSGSVVASTLFHASCNVLMVLLDTCYGVIKP